MSEYQFPRQDALFALQQLVGFEALCEQAKLDDIGDELAVAILDEAAKFGQQQLAPSNQVGDRESATLTDQGVQESPGFAEIYHQFCEGGWPSLLGDPEYGGQGLPTVLSTAVSEVWQSANLAWSLCPLLTQGAIEAIHAHASDELKAQYLPKLISGEWTATMNLTEPAAGTDLAAITSKARPEGDHYRISGQKIFITWGDHQMTDNVVHLVLARLPDAPAGPKGISLFLVPKFLLDENGNPAERNDAKATALEHKLGIHGSPTCVMSFGDDEGAIGYLVGQPHAGLMCMFTMMNNARQGVGLQGLAISERAYQRAREYAKERVQGRSKDGQPLTIINFPDVRRMLMQMKAATEAMRALTYVAAADIDRAEHAEGKDKAILQRRVALYTPIVKGWITELSQEVTYLGVQIHGGMGFIEETGAAQHYRDARILTIYEGTTGIQALDLVGRKVAADGGEALASLLDDIRSDLELIGDELATERAAVAKVLEQAVQVRQWLLQQTDAQQGAGGSVNIMMLMGYLCGGWQMLRAAHIAKQQLAAGEGDAEYLQAKLITTKAYCEQLLPRTDGLFTSALKGADTLMSLSEQQF